jgi:hypothetical protein
MAGKARLLTGWLLIVLPAFFILSSCDKFEGDQTVPSYLKIDSLFFYSNDDTQGSDNQKITDAWVYVNDDLIGGFELPALIPILTEGTQKLEIRPGIILNGIPDTRAPNPCFKPIIYSSFDFYKDSVVQATGSSTYYENAEFVWMENFEDASLSIHPSANSDTVIYRTSPANAPGAYLDDHSEFSGVCWLDNDRSYVQLVSDDGNGEGFVFDRGDFVFLELNYRTDVPLVVGFYIVLSDLTVEERSFLIINPNEDWKKIYVNFTPIVNETVDALNYKVYIEAQLPVDTDQAAIYLDNIKLVTRPNL